MPAGFGNRLAANFTLLFAIADLADGDWPKRARAAALRLTREHDEPSWGKKLLAAFRDDLFEKHGKALPPLKSPSCSPTSMRIGKTITATP